MQLYWVGDRYVRTQGEAKKLGFGTIVTEVPTDKDGLMEFINKIHAHHALGAAYSAMDAAEASTVPETPKPAEEENLGPSRRSMAACDVLSRLDSPEVNVEGVVEAIAKARGHALRRYAGAVAVRYHELELL